MKELQEKIRDPIMIKSGSSICTPLRIAFLYAFIGILWILFSDTILFALAPDTELLSRLQTYKGWFFVLITALLLFGLMNRMVSRRQAIQLELEKYRDHLEELVQDRTVELETSQTALRNIVEDLNLKTVELELANARLRELDRLKSMFIASMSHELRTPLNSIIGFSSIILQGMSGAINEEQRDQLGRVVRAGKHLLALITDVIDIARIESGRIVPYAEEFDLHAVIDEVVGQVGPQAADKGLIIEQQLPEGPLLLYSDRKRLLQCLLNFVSNAIKFSERGTVTVGLAWQAAGEWVEIRVSDTGIGIREEDMALLFGSFVRLESHLKIGTPGTGLGLYQTKKLAIEVLAGEVSVESREGEGSTFTLRIPRRLNRDDNDNNTVMAGRE